MGLLIDSTVAIHAERRGLTPAQLIDELQERYGDVPLAMSVMSAAELFHGCRRADTPSRRARREEFVEALLSAVPVVPMTLTAARIFGEIGANLRAAGLPVPTSDLLIAATALSRDDDVVTGDTRHFARVPGLAVQVLPSGSRQAFRTPNGTRGIIGSMIESFGEFRVSNDALADGAELRRRMGDEGYLFFRGLLDPDRLTALRRDMLEVIAGNGWLVPGSDPVDGIADPDRRCTEGDLDYVDVYHQVYRLESFHRAGHWPEVLDVLGKVIDGPVFAFPHKIARIWFPQFTEHTTPIHQDFVHFQSSMDVYSCWHPVGDCPRDLGGLAVLPGSHRVGRVVDHHFSLGAGSLSIDPEEHPDGWVSTDYQLGDVLFFHALTIHGALPNVTPDRLRVSLDNRYQRMGSPVTDHMLDPHLSGHQPLSWDQVYAGWSGSEDLRYYWHDYEFEVIDKDTSFQEKGFAEAVERARSGDPLARLHLQRIVTMHPDSEQAQIAERILAEAAPVA